MFSYFMYIHSFRTVTVNAYVLLMLVIHTWSTCTLFVTLHVCLSQYCVNGGFIPFIMLINGTGATQ